MLNEYKQNQISLLCRVKISEGAYGLFCSKHINFYHEITRPYVNCNGYAIIEPRQKNSTDSDTFSLQLKEIYFFSFHNQMVTRNEMIATMTTKKSSQDKAKESHTIPSIFTV